MSDDTKKKTEKDNAPKTAEAKAAPKAAPKAAAGKSNAVKTGKVRLQSYYEETIRPELMKKFSYTNMLQAPRLEKIVINMGVGEAVNDNKKVAQAVEELTLIAGQRAVITRSKNAIATFKTRKGLAIGCKVTLRSDKMYEFMDRFVNMALPRVRDFRGISTRSFDGHGNYAMGLKEQLVFPEINYDKIGEIRGMDIVFVTTANTDEEARALLEGFSMPFMK